MAIFSDDNKEKTYCKPKEKNPLIKTEEIEYDKTFENSIRPSTFADYIGQTELKETLKVSIEADGKLSLRSNGSISFRLL